MKIKEFKLERFFAEYEFNTKYLLSSSDCDGYSLEYVLAQADAFELSLWENLTLGYTESNGNHLLRKSISDLYESIESENVVVASPGELNFAVMNSLLDKKDHVICISPSYQSLSQVVVSIGCEISFWKPNPENWKFNVDDISNLIKKNTKMIIINFPHNPTGALLSKDELIEIVRIAKKNDLYIFSDEMYGMLTYNNEEFLPVCDLYEKGISLWGMSKSFGLAGLRIGWIASKDKYLLQKILSFKDYLSICSSAVSEILSLIAINHKENFINPNLQKIKKNIEIFKKFVGKYSLLFDFIPPKSGSVSFVKINSEESSLDFAKKLVESKGIMTVPAEMFDYPGKYLRIGFGRSNFEQALNEFDFFLTADYLSK